MKSFQVGGIAKKRLGNLLRTLASQRLIRSAQDVADGGLAIALAEGALLSGTGATLEVTGVPEVMLFSEDQGRAVVTCRPADAAAVLGLAARHEVAACLAGGTGGDRLSIAGVLDIDLAALRAAWEGRE